MVLWVRLGRDKESPPPHPPTTTTPSYTVPFWINVPGSHSHTHHSRIQDRYPVVESITFLSRFINFIFKFTFKCGARLLSLEFIYAATAILLYSYVINAAAFRGINADSYKIYSHRERDRKGMMHFLPNKYSKHKFIVSIHHHHHWSSTRPPFLSSPAGLPILHIQQMKRNEGGLDRDSGIICPV